MKITMKSRNPKRQLLSKIKHLLYFVSLCTLVNACTPSSTSSADTQIITNAATDSWIGAPQGELYASWGEPNKVTEQYVMYLLTDMSQMVEDMAEKDLDHGPKTQGVDDDLLKSVGKALRDSCFATFYHDPKGLITRAELSTFGDGSACENINIPSRGSEDSALADDPTTLLVTLLANHPDLVKTYNMVLSEGAFGSAIDMDARELADGYQDALRTKMRADFTSLELLNALEFVQQNGEIPSSISDWHRENLARTLFWFAPDGEEGAMIMYDPSAVLPATTREG